MGGDVWGMLSSSYGGLSAVRNLPGAEGHEVFLRKSINPTLREVPEVSTLGSNSISEERSLQEWN